MNFYTNIKYHLFSNESLLKNYNYFLEKQKSRTLNYLVLCVLIFYHIILRQRKLVFNKSRNITKLENTIAKREPIEQVVEKFSRYDIISFDIFDTLIFRPFENPTDSFYLLEAENKLLSFMKYRREAESEARKNTTKANDEINIFDIYAELQNYYDISAPYNMAEKEIELEKQICYANPYMFEIYKKLLEKGKKIIAVSDMYIPEQYMRQILDSCGYTGITDIFVSCDYGVTKTSGLLPKLVKEKIGKEKTIIHIDDNRKCIAGCKKASWITYHYKQCNAIGSPYRINYTHSPVAQMYKGIINNYLHCGAYKLNPQEEIGFAYAGIAVCGYVEWINNFCKKNNCDKILFLARDMDIFYKVYDQYYGDIPHEYVQSSRNALRQLYFEHCPGDFLEQIVDARIDMNKTFENTLQEADLDFLINTAKKSGIDLNKILSNSNKRELKKLIIDNKEEIIKAYNASNEPARQYFKEKIGSAKKICIAGLGWAGSELIYLKWLINDKWKLPVEIMGTMFGADINDKANSLYFRKEWESYAFNCSLNTNLLFEITKQYMVSHLAVEHIFTSQEASLLKFSTDETNRLIFIRNEKNPNKELIAHVQNGIIEFVNELKKHRRSFQGKIPINGADAYTPLYILLDNYKYLSITMGDFMENPRTLTGMSKNKDYIPLKKMLK